MPASALATQKPSTGNCIVYPSLTQGLLQYTMGFSGRQSCLAAMYYLQKVFWSAFVERVK